MQQAGSDCQFIISFSTPGSRSYQLEAKDRCGAAPALARDAGFPRQPLTGACMPAPAVGALQR